MSGDVSDSSARRILRQKIGRNFIWTHQCLSRYPP